MPDFREGKQQVNTYDGFLETEMHKVFPKFSKHSCFHVVIFILVPSPETVSLMLGATNSHNDKCPMTEERK